ncbi:MAG: hypothetical protein HFF14_11345 [Angelakisella sp.]|nr:hypothetical protein [Angelakisella sp.]
MFTLVGPAFPAARRQKMAGRHQLNILPKHNTACQAVFARYLDVLQDIPRAFLVIMPSF